MKSPLADGGRLISRFRIVLRYVREGFSFIVAPQGTGTTVTFNLPGRVAVLILVLVVVFVAGIAFVGVTYTKLAFLALETKRLRAENEVLRRENEKIGEIESELARIDKIRRAIEAWAGVLPGTVTEASRAGEYTLAPSVWPRRYTYAIMKPFYAGQETYPQGMVRPTNGWISRKFIRNGGREPGHPGIDIAASKGMPVRCALDGVVTFAGWDDVYGNLIVIEHGDSISTVYGHNEKILVKEGDYVAKGQVIAAIGSTGRSTAPHLHFEVLRGKEAVDPERYVDFTKD